MRTFPLFGYFKRFIKRRTASHPHLRRNQLHAPPDAQPRDKQQGDTYPNHNLTENLTVTVGDPVKSQSVDKAATVAVRTGTVGAQSNEDATVDTQLRELENFFLFM